MWRLRQCWASPKRRRTVQHVYPGVWLRCFRVRFPGKPVVFGEFSACLGLSSRESVGRIIASAQEGSQNPSRTRERFLRALRVSNGRPETSICLRCFSPPLLVLKGIYHYCFFFPEGLSKWREMSKIGRWEKPGLKVTDILQRGRLCGELDAWIPWPESMDSITGGLKRSV